MWSLVPPLAALLPKVAKIGEDGNDVQFLERVEKVRSVLIARYVHIASPRNPCRKLLFQSGRFNSIQFNQGQCVSRDESRNRALLAYIKGCPSRAFTNILVSSVTRIMKEWLYYFIRLGQNMYPFYQIWLRCKRNKASEKFPLISLVDDLEKQSKPHRFVIRHKRVACVLHIVLSSSCSFNK